MPITALCTKFQTGSQMTDAKAVCIAQYKTSSSNVLLTAKPYHFQFFIIFQYITSTRIRISGDVTHRTLAVQFTFLSTKDIPLLHWIVWNDLEAYTQLLSPEIL